MRSRLITAAFDHPTGDAATTFARHLRETLDLDEADRNACLDFFPRVHLARTDRETQKVVDDLAAARQVERHKLEHGLSIMGFFVKALLSEALPDNDPGLWADDLQELGWVDDSSRAAFEAMLESVRSRLLPQMRPLVDEKRAAAAVLPSFESLGITVEVRAIRKDVYRWGTRIEEYRPEVLGTTSIACVHIGMDVGMPKDIYFQADEKDLDNIIASFVATKKDMAALRAYLKLDDSGRVQEANG